MENPDDLQRLRIVPVDDQVRINQKEPVPFVRHFLTPVPDGGVLRQSDHACIIKFCQLLITVVGANRVVPKTVAPPVRPCGTTLH